MSDEEDFSLSEDDLEAFFPEWLRESGRPDEELAAEEDLASEEERERRFREEVAQALGPRIPRRRHIYKSSEWTRISPRQFRCRVTILSAAGEFSGEAEGPEVPALRPEIAARATLDALQQAEAGKFMLALKGARVLKVFDGPIAIVGVYGLNTRTTSLIGACHVRESVEHAAILATLQAADRWLAWQSRVSPE